VSELRHNRFWTLRQYPRGLPQPDDFALAEARLGEPQPGQVCVRVLYLSMDPAPRLRMDPKARLGPPLRLGDMVIGRGAGVVEHSNTPQFRPGDYVVGELGWQEHAVVAGKDLRRVDRRLGALSTHLGLLASSGLTAYFALRNCAAAREGEVVVVSAAAGSVGLAACQIALALGCRVVAIAHGAAQARFLRQQLKLAVVDDLEAAALGPALDAALPGPVDVFLDSVGGELHNQVMERINVAARAVLYGFISAYNASAGQEPEYGRIYQLIKKRAHLMGFLLADHEAHVPLARQALSAWMREGRLQAFESITAGFELVPRAFAAMFGEAEPGKHLVRIGEEPTDQQSDTECTK